MALARDVETPPGLGAAARGELRRVVDYYNSTLLQYWAFWVGRTDLAMHLGYHDETGRPHSEALLRMNAVLSRLGGVCAADRLLDAGCGYGGTTLWLAEHVGCRATGITIVPYQADRARRAAVRRRLGSRVSFHVEDYARTSFASSSFDVIWGLESVVHAPDKQAFVRESARLLRPRGRLLISEYMLRSSPPLSSGERAFLEPWLEGWAMPGLLTSREYEDAVRRAGLAAARTHDLTEAILPSSRRLERVASWFLPLGRLLRAAGVIGQPELANIVATVRQGEALRRGLWRYVVLVAEKPA